MRAAGFLLLMLSIFEQAFSCCIRRQHVPEDEDANRALLPPSVDTPATYTDIIHPDQQYIKDRMVGIVRSKQSKMVNLSKAAPFNLSNSEFPASGSGGSFSRTRTREGSMQRSRSPGISSPRSESSGSRRASSSYLPSGDGERRNVRLVKNPGSTLKRGRSLTLKPTPNSLPRNNGDVGRDLGVAEVGSQATDVRRSPTSSLKERSQPSRSPSPEPKPIPEYVIEGVTELTSGWGD